MALPSQPVTFAVADIEELSRQFSAFRHDVNGCLALVVAATELIRYNPDVAKRMTATLVEQPPKIAGKLREFIEYCERALGLRAAAEDSWNAVLGRRAYTGPGMPAAAVSVDPKQAKLMHGELLQVNKELGALGFLIAGARSLTETDPANAPDALATVADQFNKVAFKFEQFVQGAERALGIVEAAGRRQVGGKPSGPVTLAPDQLALFQRRLHNLQHDLQEPLALLIELGRLVRRDPRALQERAVEFSKPPPAISAELQTFGEVFDKTFGIVRAAG